jgi:hypothetical protein
MTPNEILQTLAPWQAAHRRRAWKPRVVDGEGAATGSRFGGAAWLPDGVAPSCGRCRAPMPLLVQIDLAAAPGELGRGLLQAFYCCDPDCEQECEGWSPFSAAHLVRIVAPGEAGAVDVARETHHAARAIVGWDAIEDGPPTQELGELGLDFRYDFKTKTVAIRCASVGLDVPSVGLDEVTAEQVSTAAAGDKLLGWPCWVQGAEYPECPKCKARMRYLVQLDSEDHLPIMWGDVGIAHITQCAEHPDVLTMGWACS